MRAILLYSTSTRARTRLEGHIPLLIPVALLTIGQVAAAGASEFAVPVWYLLAPIALSLLITTRTIFVLFGVVLVWSSVPTVVPETASDATYLLEVVEEPRRKSPGAVSFVAQVHGGADPWRGLVACRGVDLPWRPLSTLRLGSLFVGRGTVRPYLAQGSPFSYVAAQRRRGIAGEMKIRMATPEYAYRSHVAGASREDLRLGVEAAVGEGERSGLLLSMALGIRDVLSTQTEELFKQAGLAHVLVFSGYQVSLVALGIFGVVRWGLLRVGGIRFARWTGLVAGAVATVAGIALVLLVGTDPVSARALLMVLLVLLARILELERRTGNAIAAALLIVTVIWPGALLEPGLQLTAAALIGLAISAKRSSGTIGTLLRSCFWASACTGIVTFARFGTVSLLGFPLNPLVAPLTSVVSCVGFAVGGALFWFGLDANAWVLTACGWFLERFRDALSLIVLLPTAPPAVGCAVVLVLGCALIWKLDRLSCQIMRGEIRD